jgi:hypothetical protein
MASNEENSKESTPNKTTSEDFDVSNYVELEDTDTEDSTPVTPVFSESVIENVQSEVLVPTFEVSAPKPFSVRPKGLSRSNLAKGKRPRTFNILGTIRGETLSEMSTSKFTSYDRQWYDHALKSQLMEKISRTKNTLILRLEEMNQNKLLSLVDSYKIFQNDNTPIAISTPSEMSKEAISKLLKVDKDSNFVTTIVSNVDLQDTMRRTLLEVKNLPICGCGYIYVHPTVTFSKNLADRSLLVGKQPGQDHVAVVSKLQAMEYLNALRYFLEIVYENLNK